MTLSSRTSARGTGQRRVETHCSDRATSGRARDCTTPPPTLRRGHHCVCMVFPTTLKLRAKKRPAITGRRRLRQGKNRPRCQYAGCPRAINKSTRRGCSSPAEKGAGTHAHSPGTTQRLIPMARPKAQEATPARNGRSLGRHPPRGIQSATKPPDGAGGKRRRGLGGRLGRHRHGRAAGGDLSIQSARRKQREAALQTPSCLQTSPVTRGRDRTTHDMSVYVEIAHTREHGDFIAFVAKWGSKP